LLRFASPSSLFALLTRSFFLSSLSFLLLVGCRLFVGSRPWAAPFLGSSPRRCSFSVPFLGLGGAPARSLPWPQRSLVLRPRLGAPSRLLTSSPSTWCSARNLWPCLGAPLRPRLGAPPWFLSAPHGTCGLIPFLGLGSSASLRCSSSAPRLRIGAPHESFGLTSVLLLGSSVFSLGSSVLQTKPAASVLLPVLTSGKFLFCSTICHPFLILHFTHSTSTSLSNPADCYFSPLLFVSIFLDSLHFFLCFILCFLSVHSFPFEYDSLRYKINLIKYPFSNQTKSNKNTIVTSKKYYCNIKKYYCNI
jgi:hypothetical protein